MTNDGNCDKFKLLSMEQLYLTYKRMTFCLCNVLMSFNVFPCSCILVKNWIRLYVFVKVGEFELL